jgi:hypothetical protein
MLRGPKHSKIEVVAPKEKEELIIYISYHNCVLRLKMVYKAETCHC